MYDVCDEDVVCSCVYYGIGLLWFGVFGVEVLVCIGVGDVFVYGVIDDGCDGGEV